uniref:Poly [ADP-ribose] polymerase n=1 Tax=Electrophorus electricus TaxID=8005 RepID=A0AAY5E7Z5_ELEEL
VFLELIWTEALGSLASLLTVPVTSLSLNDVSRVEGLLLQVQKCESEDEVQLLLQEVSTLLPLRETEAEARAKLVSQRLDLCQLIRDILNVSEATLGNPSPSSLGKYRALRCNIQPVASESPEYQSVCKLLQERPVQIQQVLRVCRSSELHMFREQLCNIKPLLHSTFPSNFVGILSRGLLLPRVGVEQHGIKRTDVGNLGSGIYFSDSLNTSVKYSRPSVTDGSRLLLVCDVALGQCKDVYKKDPSLICAPDGHSSVHGVHPDTLCRVCFLQDDEYVVYNTDQVRLKYVVQYFLKEDQPKPFEPHIDTSVELSSDDAEGLEVTKNPLEDVTPGLLDSSGSTLPLEAVHVRCKLMDLLCQVIIFQVYTNKSDVPIEAKYVFPLEETAAVCGFEAFINGKHVVGKVKEKEQARKEYKQAIEKGHGAYLMDQEAPDVFTISVGNLPAGATVLIKVTYITELVVRSGTVVFSLPASVAPWQQSAALNQRTQVPWQLVFSLHMSIEMPYEITGLECSHHIRTKRTDCKAVVMTLPDQSLSTDGFQLSFSLSQMHMPRMWVEKHPEKDSEACMLVFYPDFECGDARWSGVSDVVIVLDTSESMRGEPLVNARRLALKALCSLDRSLRVNVVCFGTGEHYKEAFPSPRVLEEVFEQAKTFIMSSPAIGGSTELWRPLRSLNLLPPSRGLRNVLLLSDGHMQNQPQTLQLVRGNACHTRLFTCGLSPTANRHMLRALAQAGGGVYEFFDAKKKHTWVKSQVRCMASPGCMSVSVKWQRFNPTAPPPVQAPSQLSALFSNCHTLVYGFVPHCSQATLFGDLSGQEIQTMVSTTELQKTKGTFLHKLTARAIIRDYEDGSLGISEAEHEGRKAELKSYIIELSKEFSILSQFTSFVAIEERVSELLAPPRHTRPYICTSFVPSLQPSLRAATSPGDIDAHLLSDVPVSSPVPPVLGGISSRIHAMSSSFFGQRSKGDYLGAEPAVSSVASLRPLSLSGAPPSSFGGRGLFGSSRRSLICLDREPSEPLNLCAGGGFSFRAPPPIDSQATSPPITSPPITSPPISSIASAYAIGFAPQIPPPPAHNAAPPVPQAPPHIAAPEIIEFARRARNSISFFMAPPPVPQATPLVPQAPPPIGFGGAIGLAHHVIPYTHQSHSYLLPQAPPPVPQAPPPPPIPAPAVIDLLPHSSSTLDTSDDLEFQFLKMVPKKGYFEKRRGSSRQDLFRFARKHVQKRRQPDTINWEESMVVTSCPACMCPYRPACWEAVQRAVSWAQGADRQYPCVCTRLELGWDWESCTRQLLGLDAPPPHSPLLPVLQRSACTTQVQK